MSHPLIMTQPALDILKAALHCDARLLSQLGQENRRTANSLTPVTTALVSINRRQVEVARALLTGLQRVVENTGRNQAFSREIQKTIDEVTAVATAVEEMAATATEISRTAQQAANRAEESNTKSQIGNEGISSLVGDMDLLETAVKSMAEGMEQFVGFTREINKLTTIVKDIAQQTNLLALNAAIEAARAGEAGRGFAVVADEVKKLADKTAQATGEIERVTTTMNSLSSKVGEGVQVSLDRLSKSVTTLENVAASLSDANAVVHDVNDRVHQIATAAEEQGVVSGEMARQLTTITTGLQNEITTVGSMSQGRREVLQSLAQAFGLLGESDSDPVAIEVGKAEHSMLKARLVDSFSDGHGLSEGERDPRQCRFGQWLHSAGQTRYGTNPAWASLVEAHERVHATAREIADMAANQGATAALGRLGELDQHNEQFIQLLSQLDPERHA